MTGRTNFTIFSFMLLYAYFVSYIDSIQFYIYNEGIKEKEIEKIEKNNKLIN